MLYTNAPNLAIAQIYFSFGHGHNSLKGISKTRPAGPGATSLFGSTIHLSVGIPSIVTAFSVLVLTKSHYWVGIGLDIICLGLVFVLIPLVNTPDKLAIASRI